MSTEPRSAALPGMTSEEFRCHAHALVDWIADYHARLRERPVRAQVAPGETLRRLPDGPPVDGEPFSALMRDFEQVILPGISHWQHPRFCAYFPANGSFPSLLAEMLTAALGAQCMSWQTSPAATELEERVMGWLRELIGLPPAFVGVIQDTASTATLCALLSARERHSAYGSNRDGLAGRPPLAVYCSEEAHSSVEKAVKIAGLGSANLRKIPVDDAFELRPVELAAAIERDRAAGLEPLAVVAALGTTGSTAVDPLGAIAAITRRHGLWLHVDAAYAGTALLLPEMRHYLEGIDAADSFVFNPHKWMFTHFDCSAYFVRDPAALVRTFEILPEYLKTAEGDRVNNYRDWGIQLGRRFRALKLWFVLRSFGASGLQARVRRHLALAQRFASWVDKAPEFERMAPVPFGTVCFRFHPPGVPAGAELDALNHALMERVNAGGKLYLSHTKLAGQVTLRLVVCQTEIELRDVELAWQVIRDAAQTLSAG